MHTHTHTLTHTYTHRLARIKEWVDANDPNAVIIPFSGALELKVHVLSRSHSWIQDS